ncbi:hypothetical protein SAMN06265795_12244 [Noviherbaspirillum humi]|uniref:Uncharacterized protein n=1 Tax=Noviherbaspirillum humi TaxID=1688639 RepID=A0A239LGP1_9BURK|nr:hypothetical protein [Noviherbaspirillum humi]SNT29003.1 hypothetical protein SAMN06265795_12244 [Noviherbaspirillum humi]
MDKHIDNGLPVTLPTDPKRGVVSSLLIAGTYVTGLLGLIPALLILLVLGGVSFVGVRFLWQFAHLLAS